MLLLGTDKDWGGVSMRRITALAIVLLLVAAVFALTGCGMIAEKATEAAIEKSTGVKVDKESGTISATDEQGNTTELSAGEGAYPEDFPSDFPQYPNGTVDSALKGTTNGQDSFTVIINTPDAAKDVFDWYLTELEKSGWTVEQKMDGTTSDSAFGSISCVKGDLKAGVTISRGADEEQTAIMVGIGPKTE
jgi:hypothetical protein